MKEEKIQEKLKFICDTQKGCIPPLYLCTVKRWKHGRVVEADTLRLGAKKYVNIDNAEDMKNVNNTLSFILSTIPAKHAPMMYVRILKVGGTLQ